MKNKKRLIYIISALAVLVSLALICAGHFSFYDRGQDKGNYPGGSTAAPSKTPEKEPSPVVYRHISDIVAGNRQEIDILEIDISRRDVKVMPVLSHDLIYGFEYLSGMVSRKKAYAAVNGGFFYRYGLPSGMVAINGELITISSGKYPVFITGGGKASLSEFESRLRLDYGSGSMKPDSMNTPAGKGEVVVYTPFYGSTDRLETENLAVTVENGIVTETGFYAGEKEIPSDGFLVVFCLPTPYNTDSLPFKKGDALKIIHEPQLPEGAQAYECGSWVVKGGKVVIGDKDAWVGVLTNRDPRTAVGIKRDGKVVLLTVDGRQPGYSIGFTGRELGEYMLGLDIINAAMLDGGASTEMIVDGRVVNKPSFKGQERPLGGGILVMVDGYGD